MPRLQFLRQIGAVALILNMSHCLNHGLTRITRIKATERTPMRNEIGYCFYCFSGSGAIDVLSLVSSLQILHRQDDLSPFLR